jgi:hypothetical protein
MSDDPDVDDQLELTDRLPEAEWLKREIVLLRQASTRWDRLFETTQLEDRVRVLEGVLALELI